MANTANSPGASAQPSDPFVGRTFGNCQILEKLNEGGTAYIYRAHNVRFDLDRVIKILKPSLMGEEDFFQRFVQEAQLTARLDHPNILRVFDTGEAEGHFFIEMEYIAGHTLREYMQQTPRLPEREIISIAKQIASALQYAHEIEIVGPSNGEAIKGLLHRDIKPENIMITAGKLVKLMDFGAAKPLNITSNTMQGMIVGTFHYMSPEQLKGQTLDARSDFFSMGIVLYEMCTGKKPFSSDNLTELIEKISACKYERIRALRPSITPMTAEIIEGLLQKKPRHRPASAREITESLNIAEQQIRLWGLGQKTRPPVPLYRILPWISIVFSGVALVVSLYSIARKAPQIESAPQPQPRRFGTSIIQPSALDKGKELEGRGLWREAMAMYELVPSPHEGGVANEYLEAQIRLAYLAFKRQQQLSRARSILETLRLTYSDPAIDAYLGEIYQSQSLYLEAKTRFEAALTSTKRSVIPQSENFRLEILYNLAQSLDKQFTHIDRSPAMRIEAIKAWHYYRESALCKDRRSKECEEAEKRIAYLEKQQG